MVVDLVVVYIVVMITGTNAVFFFSALDRNKRTRQLIRGYLEDIRERGGRIPTYLRPPIRMPTGLARKMSLLRIKLQRKGKK